MYYGPFEIDDQQTEWNGPFEIDDQQTEWPFDEQQSTFDWDNLDNVYYDKIGDDIDAYYDEGELTDETNDIDFGFSIPQ